MKVTLTEWRCWVCGRLGKEPLVWDLEDADRVNWLLGHVMQGTLRPRCPGCTELEAALDKAGKEGE